MNTTVAVNEGVRTPYSYSSSFLVLRREADWTRTDGQRDAGGMGVSMTGFVRDHESGLDWTHGGDDEDSRRVQVAS